MPASSFYDKFQPEADECGRDFMKRYNDDLNTALTSVSILFACTSVVMFITSAFAVDVQEGPQPDHQRNELRPPQDCRQCLARECSNRYRCCFRYMGWSRSHCRSRPTTLYSSFGASVLVAFTPMLDKQCLNSHAQAEMRGSDHGGYRQRKTNGMVTWRFDHIMECMLLVLQAAPLGYALSDYLFFINKVAASVIIVSPSFSLLFYLATVSVATLSYGCPFRTPFFSVLCSLVRFDDKRKKYLKRTRKWLGRIVPQ